MTASLNQSSGKPASEMVRWLAATVVAATLSACAMLGPEFRPGFASTDKNLFAEPPVVVHRVGGYILSWTYGEWGFVFFPYSKVVDGKLIFTLEASTSTGSRRGQHGEVPIEEASAVAALESGGAWWWEPSGELTRLRVVDEAHP